MKAQELIKKIKKEGIEVPEMGIRIIPRPLFKRKLYKEETLKEVTEEFIGTYDVLQKLRNIAFKSNWKKYPFMKSFWVFVPNPDRASKLNYVTMFDADPDKGILLKCDRYPSDGGPVLGVFLYCSIDKKDKVRENN